MSGSAVHFWSLSSVQNKIEYAYEMARTWAKPVANLNELIDVLKTISADKFIEYSSLASKIGRIFEIPNGPVIEGKQHKQYQFHLPVFGFASSLLVKHNFLSNFFKRHFLGFNDKK